MQRFVQHGIARPPIYLSLSKAMPKATRASRCLVPQRRDALPHCTVVRRLPTHSAEPSLATTRPLLLYGAVCLGQVMFWAFGGGGSELWDAAGPAQIACHPSFSFLSIARRTAAQDHPCMTQPPASRRKEGL